MHFSFRLSHHEALQTRRTRIRGSDSDSDRNDDNEKDDDEYGDDDDIGDDNEWGPATEL